MSFGDKAHCWPKSLEEAAVCRPTYWRASAVMFFLSLFWKSLTFAWIALSGFQSTGSVFLFMPLIFAWTPLRVFSPPGRSLLPKSPFQAFNLASFLMIFFDFFCMTASCSKRRFSPWCLAMFLFWSVTVLEADADVRFNYSWIQRRCVCCSHFSKDVKKVFVFWKFLLQVLPSKNRRNFVCRINESSK